MSDRHPPPPGRTLDLIDHIDACLPQTQCTRCGYPSCRAYAAAVVHGDADFNQCPPGGDYTLNRLATLLHRPAQPLNARFGEAPPRARARIDESACIGCRKCIDACPLDAIVGARKLMHTVLAADCSGCALCVPVCPVDCIAMISVPANGGDSWPQYGEPEVARWRRRALRRALRLAQPRRRASPSTAPRSDADSARAQRRAEIRAAVERVRAKRANHS